MSKKSFDADVIIIGAGPAGLSAATWCVELGLDTIIFEKEAEPGGQLLRIFNPVTNYLGLETANGRELRDHFLHTFESRKPVTRLSAKITEIDPVGKSIVTTGGDRLTARALIIATGVRRRRLNVPGEEKFIGKGIIDSGSKEKEKAENKRVVIVGGGDAALENALILADFASKVYVVHRRSELSARSEFTEKARQNPKIEFRLETVVNAIKGGSKVESVELTNLTNGKTEESRSGNRFSPNRRQAQHQNSKGPDRPRPKRLYPDKQQLRNKFYGRLRHRRRSKSGCPNDQYRHRHGSHGRKSDFRFAESCKKMYNRCNSNPKI